jgi:hypothetical protein
MSIATAPRILEPAFEIVAFAATPVDGGVAVLELRGHFPAGAPRRFDRARLRVERLGESVELPALHDSGNAPVWSATFAVAIDALQDATFALAVGRGFLLDLPAPDVQTPDSSPAADYVRVAREANRHRRGVFELQAALDAEREARALIQRHADDTTLERDQAARDRDAAAQERDAAQAHLSAGLEELGAERARIAQETAQQIAAAQALHEQTTAEAQHGHEVEREALAQAHAQSVAELEHANAEELASARANADVARAEADDARGQLRALRAELTAAHQALRAAQDAVAQTPVPRTLVETPPVGVRTYAEADRFDEGVTEEAEPEELRTLEAPRGGAARMPAGLQFPAHPRELLALAADPDNRPRTIALSVLAAAFVAFAAALGIGPL